MSDPVQEWIRSMGIAWSAGESGDYEMSLRCYKYAQEMIDCINLPTPIDINPELSMVRHNPNASAKGYITPFPPTEDMVMSVQLPSELKESKDARGMSPPEISQQRLKKNIEFYDIPVTQAPAPNLMVLSTGRVGTVSLYRLLERTQYMPYHSYLMQGPHNERIEMACRFISGVFSPRTYTPENTWQKLRGAELQGAANERRPMAMLNHLDTIFAPLYALINPEAKFLFLRRDPEKVFKSFYSKNQFGHNQLEPVYFKFDPDFKYRRALLDLPVTIAWYIKFTEAFSRAFGEVHPDRFMEISSDKIFSQDDEEIARLSEFMDFDKDITREHFGTVYNEKAHKVDKTDEQIESGLKAFRRAYSE